MLSLITTRQDIFRSFFTENNLMTVSHHDNIFPFRRMVQTDNMIKVDVLGSIHSVNLYKVTHNR